MTNLLPSAEWRIAQINVGRRVAPKGDPRVSESFDALDRVNVLADGSAGFIWRLQSESGDATDIEPTSDPLLNVNMSLWTTRKRCSNSSIEVLTHR